MIRLVEKSALKPWPIILKNKNYYMSKLYKLVFIIIVSFLAFLNISFFLYNKELASYFKIDTISEDPQLIKNRIEQESSDSFFDLSKLNNPKFINLKEFSVDLTGFNLPGNLNLEEEQVQEGEQELPTEIIDDGTQVPSFEVGNQNPFEPIKK